jgi:hypothetical protein
MAEGKRRELAGDSEEDDQSRDSDGSGEEGSEQDEDGDSDFDSYFRRRCVESTTIKSDENDHQAAESSPGSFNSGKN